MPNFSHVLSDSLGATTPNEAVNILRGLYALHETSQHVPLVVNDEDAFPLSAYLHSVNVTPTVHASTATAETYTLYPYDGRKQIVYPDVIAGKTTFTVDGTTFTAYKATWMRDSMESWFYDLVFDGPDASAGIALANAVYKYGGTLREEIWVYQSASWKADKQLYKAVHAARWDDVVLDDKFKEGLRRDTRGFFESKDVYEQLEITWKRGILLLGPPGNGKTESIKALLRETDYPALYVKSFTTPYGPEYGVRSIFAHARKHAPCILVLEDLDAMVTPKVRSFFLNELDGLAANSGILTIATTNHPERIDDAILNRPSRFDVKYTYELPSRDLRVAFARKWVAKMVGKPAGEATQGIKFQMAEKDIAEKVADLTEGFSFAFLKELFVSFLLSVAHTRSVQAASTPYEDLLFAQVSALSAQIIKIANPDEKKEEEKVEEGAADEPNSCWSPPDPVAKSSAHSGANF
ncbi:hypothetical protein EWM64_g1990 [Hericium alpestre]|uniref:AAA+ ATPase domain-containing protein n=1 Tax=Hericium alpestre TaxID=135208 RepID=A0A4Z0A8W0_9AGAM|nr:hypothetical protein EWM64_g1990 [Hericium alpestre]